LISISASTNLKATNKNAYRSEDKYCFGKATSFNFKEVTVANIKELLPILLTQAVSPYIYKGGHRHASKVTGLGNLVILDIDSPTDISQVLLACVAQMNFDYGIIPTQNHLNVSKGILYYKYRLVIPVAGVTTAVQYKAVIHWLINTYQLPEVDSASWTDARFYAPTLPTIGSTYNSYDAVTNPTQFTVTEQEYNNTLHRLGMLGEDGEPILPADMYPVQDNGTYLAFDDSMLQFAPVEEEVHHTSEISGKTTVSVYSDVSNTMDSKEVARLSKQGLVSIGEVAGKMLQSDRVMCECPTSYNHTDPNDKRYAWLLKTGAGDVRLYCGSDHCRKDFGDFRQIVLPDWTDFIGDNNYDTTVNRLNQIYSSVTANLLTALTDAICKYKNVEVEKYHEGRAYANEVLFAELMDANALKIMCLLINATEKGATPTLTDISLDGSMLGKLVVKKAKLLMASSWNSYIYKSGFTDFVRETKDDQLTKAKMFDLIANTVTTDIYFTSVIKQIDLLKPSQIFKGSIKVDLPSSGREVTYTANNFDTPVYRKKKRLEREGVLNNTDRYNEVVSAFSSHWKLPYGSVDVNGFEVVDLPTLIILLSSLNMYSDGKANQRHTALVVTAPSGIGKTSLIGNMSEIGLSNGDEHSASVFGYKDLYPKSVDDMKNKLWATGDELSPTMFKDISVPNLLGNLTRDIVNVNVKGKIDSGFTAFFKVLYGARAWEAISQGSQATELRNRLFAITYTEEHFMKNGEVTTDFLTLCDDDRGDIDNIIQHRLATIYFAVKSWVLAMPMGDRVAMFNHARYVTKAKYAGTINWVTEFDEDTDEIIGAKPEKVKSDTDRTLDDLIEIFLKYRADIVTNPTKGEGTILFTALTKDTESSYSALTARDAKVYKAEEFTYALSKSPWCEEEQALVLPNIRDSIELEDYAKQVIATVVGFETRQYWKIVNNLSIKAWRKVMYGSKNGHSTLKDFEGATNRALATTSIPQKFEGAYTNAEHTTIRGLKNKSFKIVSLNALNDFLDAN